MGQNKAKKAEAALERVRNAGRIAKQHTKARSATITGAVATGVLGYLDANKPGSAYLGPVHMSMLGVPLAFASAFTKGATGKWLEQAAGPLLGVATYRMGFKGSVLGGEYDPEDGQQY